MRQHNTLGRAISSQSNNTKRRRGTGALALAAAAVASAGVMSAPSGAWGATKLWIAAGSGNWSTAANWSGATVPAVTGDTVNVTDAAAGVKTVTLDNAATTTSMLSLTVGGSINTFTGAMTLAIPAGSTKSVSITSVSVGGTAASATAQGKIQQDGGTFAATSGLVIGGVALGVYNLTAGQLTVATENQAAAAFAVSSFTQSGGTHTATSILAGSDPSAASTYSLGGGTLNATNETLGNLGSSTFTQTNGVHNVTGAAGTDNLQLAAAANSFATYNLSGGTLSVSAAGGAVIGKGGNAGFTQSGGTMTLTAGRDLQIGSLAGGVGSYTLTAGTLSAGGNVYVGGTNAAAGGTGTMVVGGTATVSGTLKIWNVNGSSVTLNSGTLSVAAIDTGGGSNSLIWNGGTLNVTGAGGLSIGAGGSLNAVTISAGQALNVTNATTLLAGGLLSMNGGAFTGSSLVAPPSSISFNSGNFTLTSGGLVVDTSGPMGANVLVPANSSISVSGAVSVVGSLSLAGGAIGGASAMTNSGATTGYGILTGAGGLTNSGLIALSGGNLTINKSGVFQNTSSGIIRMDSGRQLQLNGGNLQNSGTLDLDGGGVINTISGAQLINASDGLITGSGTINVTLSNSGTIIVPATVLTVTNPFTNTGIIRLGDISSRLSVGGGGLTNSSGGAIQGIGRISATLTNAGYVEAIGGVLQLAGTTNNNAGGTLAATVGNQIFITGTPGPNAGSISLTGGTLHTNGQALTNSATGVISGYGTLRTGGLTNNGQLQLSGGSTFVYGSVTSNSLSKIIVSGGSTATFYDPVTMVLGSEFRVSTNSTAVFFAPVTGQSNFTGFGTKNFEAGGSLLTTTLMTSGSSIVQQGASLTAPGIRENSLTVNGQVVIPADGSSASTSRLGALSINSGATLDLTNNKLIVAAGDLGSWNGSAYTGVTGMIAGGRNGNAGPLWDGSGIVTSQPEAASTNFTSIAVATAGAVGKGGGTFGGIGVNGNDVLVMYTYGGDANLDGKLNIDDYVRIDQGIAAGLSGWSNGDFNYDGKINIDDYTTVIDSNIGNQGAPFVTAGGVGEFSTAAVPEPAIGAIVAIAGIGLRRRRAQR